MQFLGYSFIYDEDAFLYNHITVSSEITSIELSDGCFDGIYVSSDSNFEITLLFRDWIVCQSKDQF